MFRIGAFLSGFLLLPLTVSGSTQPAEQYYREIDCKPLPLSTSPQKYDCGIFNQMKDDMCYYNGINHPVGKRLSESDIKDPCLVGCTCVDMFGKPSFNCAHVECPSLFNPTIEEGCTRIYEHGTCCSVDKHCEERDPPLPTCEYNGKIYKKGEKIYPEEGCLNCICMEGFNGTLSEPWCKKIECNMYLHYSNNIREGCIPTYYKPTDCCPIPVWRCPSESDTIVEEDTPVIKAQDDACVFGKLHLAIGQKLSPKERCVECSCLVPPHVTCTMNRECYENQ